MILGVLSDAHGHVEGFLEGLTLLRRMGADRVFFLGDAVGYLPGSEVVDAIVAEGVEPVAGNHEAMLLDPPSGIDDSIFRFAATRRALGPSGLQRIAVWPDSRTLDTPAGPILLGHTAPWPDRPRLYPDTDPETLPALPWRFVFMGHTHRAFIAETAATTFVNVGSCGFPRDDGLLGSVATLDTLTGTVRIVRFDLERATRAAFERVDSVPPLLYTAVARRERPHRTARRTLCAGHPRRSR